MIFTRFELRPNSAAWLAAAIALCLAGSGRSAEASCGDHLNVAVEVSPSSRFAAETSLGGPHGFDDHMGRWRPRSGCPFGQCDRQPDRSDVPVPTSFPRVSSEQFGLLPDAPGAPHQDRDASTLGWTDRTWFPPPRHRLERPPKA